MTGRVLAVDVGTRRLGVAVSDPTGTVASPLATVPRRTPAEDAKALGALAAEHAATTVVVGLPVTLAGREGPAGAPPRAPRGRGPGGGERVPADLAGRGEAGPGGYRPVSGRGSGPAGVPR
jgi:hypothetical protein